MYLSSLFSSSSEQFFWTYHVIQTSWPFTEEPRCSLMRNIIAVLVSKIGPSDVTIHFSVISNARIRILYPLILQQLLIPVILIWIARAFSQIVTGE